MRVDAGRIKASYYRDSPSAVPRPGSLRDCEVCTTENTGSQRDRIDREGAESLAIVTAWLRPAEIPVTNFTRGRDAYWRAERHNRELDRDNDRIACEKR